LSKDPAPSKDEAISLRYDYGWTERRIAGQLNVKKSTIHSWLPNNSHTGLPNNIQLLEGDCLKILPTLPDNSIELNDLLTKGFSLNTIASPQS
jgi:transcriptional regulator with XRE-family HTH domain